MKRSLVILAYNLILPFFFILSFPLWLIKMAKRGGIGSGLLERFSWFEEQAEFEKQGVVYIHAVSVGEVLIAIKLIKEWLVQYPDERILLVPTTATGNAVAKEHAPEGVRVIYSPLDFSFIVTRVINRFQPKQIILMESEIWPNLLNVARKMKIPVSIANARLSARSEGRYQKLGFMLKPLLEMISMLCAQDEGDQQRWVNVGVDESKVVVTGSVKFDQSGAVKPQQREGFSAMLDTVGGGANVPVVMAISTHAGEEAWIAEALSSRKNDLLLVIAPRHAERRSEVKLDLEGVGYSVMLRSENLSQSDCLIIDSTGELRDWTAHADVVIVGKSILGKGGQNPTEAMAAGVPVIVGPFMRNFEPLVSDLKSQGGVTEIITEKELEQAVMDLLGNADLRSKQTVAAKEVLKSHQGATIRTVEVLRK